MSILRWLVRPAAIATCATSLLAACVGLLGPLPGPYPEACAGYGFTARRCAAVVTRGLEDAGLRRGDVVAIELLAIPEQPPHFGQGTVAVLGFRLSDGTVVRQEIVCPGISGAFDPACGDEARVHVGTGVDRDIPCDANGVGCATLPPTPPPDLVEAATPIRIAERDIVVDHTGTYELLLGAGTLPSGYLSERTVTLADDQPTAFWLEGARLEVRSAIAGRPPIGSIYRDPYDGLEPVQVFFVFEVTRYSSPGTLTIRDVLVR